MTPSGPFDVVAFRHAVQALHAKGPYALAVSGGADSLALLALAQAAFPGEIAALSVDHRMRPESMGECAYVAALCRSLGVPHTTLTVVHTLHSQADARLARYQLLGDWCATHAYPFLLTAHHQQDQAETLLLRLMRGSGLRGLAGIRPCRPLREGVTLLRPLLSVPRARLAALTREAGWKAVEDPSNANPHYARTRARALLGREPLLMPERLARTAVNLQAEEEALVWITEQAFAARATVAADGRLILDMEALPAALRRRLLLRAFDSLGKPAPRHLESLLARLTCGEDANLAGILVRHGKDGRLHLTPEPRRKPCPARQAKP